MPSLVVPFRGAKGKSRLGRFPGSAREALALAMLEDVLDACVAVGPTFVVGPAMSAPGLDGVTLVPDPGGGQGAAVRAGLEAASLASGGAGPFIVVNADLPCVTARDLLALAGAVPDDGLALAPATDGTTNALALSSLAVYSPVYGPGSAERFAALGPSRTVEAPNLMDDVDTAADLERVRGRLGPRTRSVLTTLRAGAAA
jgi:2-phospho-L-lactate guanylyltransferase